MNLSQIKPIIYLRAGHSGIHPTTGHYLTMQTEGGKFYKHTNGKKYHKDGYFFEGVSNRNICNEIIKLAPDFNFHVVPVHHPYNDFELKEYCEFANNHFKENATPHSPCVFLDIHSNAGKSSGFVALYYPGTVQNGEPIHTPSRSGLLLAQKIAAQVNPIWLNEGANYGGQPVRPGWIYNKFGKIQAPYYMLANTNMPSVIIENGFFDTEEDADLLMKPEFQKLLAVSILEGTQDYFAAI